MSEFLKLEAVDIDGRPRPLMDEGAKIYLVVNVASRCGYTKQYAGLETLHRDLGPRGLRVYGFPCNQFGRQEPGSASEIKQFVQSKYELSFPLFEKVEVNGDGRHPLFAWLTPQKTEPKGPGDVEWNFEKFLVDAEGRLLARFASSASPESLRARIEEHLS